MIEDKTPDIGYLLVAEPQFSEFSFNYIRTCLLVADKDQLAVLRVFRRNRLAAIMQEPCQTQQGVSG